MLSKELTSLVQNFDLAVVINNNAFLECINDIVNNQLLFKTFRSIDQECCDFILNSDIRILLIDFYSIDHRQMLDLCNKCTNKNIKIIALINNNLNYKEKTALIEMGFYDYLECDSIRENLIPKINIWSQTRTSNVLVYKNLVMDFENISVTFYQEEIKLSVKEFMILKCLMINAEKSQTREEIIKHVWKKTNIIDERTVDVNINRLRNNLKSAHPNREDIIHTIRSMGYCLKIEE